MQKSKSAQKGAGKQRPGSEQARSGTSLQKDEGEKIQAPRAGEQQKKEGRRPSRGAPVEG